MLPLDSVPQPQKVSALTYSNREAIGPLLDRVYSMRYRSYNAENYIDDCASEKFMDEYDSAPNCTSYLTYCDKKAIGSIRSCIYDPGERLPIPVMDAFHKELESAVSFNDVMIEANKFVIEPSFQQCGGVKSRFSIYKNIADSIIENNAKFLVACIRTEHIKFYKMLKFVLASGVKSYPHLNFKTVLVVCENVDAFCERVYSKTEPRRMVNGALLSHGVN